MKKIITFVPLLLVAIAFQVAAGTPLHGRIVALDAGHGGGATGAIGMCGETAVIEADVNLAVRAELKAKLEASGATVFEVPPLSSRKDRVASAEVAGSEALISIHHNGSSDTSVDYTKSFITQNNDKALAKPIQSTLVAALGLPDNGIKHDGFGITVYGDIPGVLTESYFITNTDAACDFLGERVRVHAEAQAMYDGLLEYFSQNGSGDDGGNRKPDKCSPWPLCRN